MLAIRVIWRNAKFPVICYRYSPKYSSKLIIMKKKFPLLLTALAFFLACQQQQPAKVDAAAEKAAVNALIDQFEATTLTDTLALFLTDDALVTGTAPTELWTKQQMVEMWQQYFSGNVPEHIYSGERTVKIAADGNSATVIEEYTMPVMSSILQARNGLHLVKLNGKWMIDFINISFIPENEDIPKIEEAIK
jgi:hypothetical protein